jgi:hypothetical protein
MLVPLFVVRECAIYLLLLLCRNGRVTDQYQLNYEAVADVIQPIPDHNLI